MPDIWFNITGTAERKGSGAHGYPGKDTEDVTVGIGAEPTQSNARTADYQEEPNSEELLRRSNLHAIVVLQTTLAKQHPSWKLDRHVLPFKNSLQGRAHLHLMKGSGASRRIVFLEISNENQTVTLIEIENTDLVRNLSLQIIEGLLNENKKAVLREEIILSSLHWNFDLSKIRHPVLGSINHKINETEESWISRIRNHLNQLISL